MLLLARDGYACYRIEAPDCCELKLDQDGTDFVVVPDPLDPTTPYWLFDEILIEAARSEDFGLRLLSVAPLN